MLSIVCEWVDVEQMLAFALGVYLILCMVICPIMWIRDKQRQKADAAWHQQWADERRHIDTRSPQVAEETSMLLKKIAQRRLAEGHDKIAADDGQSV